MRRLVKKRKILRFKVDEFQQKSGNKSATNKGNRVHSIGRCRIFIIILMVILVVYWMVKQCFIIYLRSAFYDLSTDIVYQDSFYVKDHHFGTINKVNEKGIIYTCSSNQFDLLYVSVKYLLFFKSEYFIEIYVTNNMEWNECNRIFKDISKYISCVRFRNNLDINNYGYKVLSLIETKYKHVLFIDCDNFMIQNPKILFESKEYSQYNLIFWPDLWGKECYTYQNNHKNGVIYSLFNYNFITQLLGNYIISRYKKYDTHYRVWSTTTKYSLIYRVLNMEYMNNYKYNHSFETGMFMINTVKYFNILKHIFYCTNYNRLDLFIQGDKDCFRMMLLKHVGYDKFYFVGQNNVDQALLLGHINHSNNYFVKDGITQFWKNKLFFIHQIKRKPSDNINEFGTHYLKMKKFRDCALHINDDKSVVYPYTVYNKTDNQRYYMEKMNTDTQWKEMWLQYYNEYSNLH